MRLSDNNAPTKYLTKKYLGSVKNEGWPKTTWFKTIINDPIIKINPSNRHEIIRIVEGFTHNSIKC